MNTGYRIKNQRGVYFITLTVVDRIDLFTRDQNRKILIDSFEYCRKVKGLKLYAYVIMTNHVHFIGECNQFPFSDFLRDFKRHTTKLLLASIKKETESREAWITHLFLSAGQKLSKYDIKHQVWKQDNHAIELESPEFTLQKMGYIHENPVRAGFVDDPNAWVYSNQRNYIGLPAILEIDLLDI